MADKKFPKSGLTIRKTVDLLPTVFKTNANDKFMSGVVDPLVQPGVLEKLVGYVGRRYGKTYNGTDVYLDTDQTLRSRYQLEPGVVVKNNNKIESFYDYLDFKNQLKFFGNNEDRDDLVTGQEHYSWNPPIEWDKFINYREYFWEPNFPPSVSVFGQKASVTSTYKVKLGIESSFIFTPDAYTNNPTITLYRGQTYKFVVDAPGEGFVIRTNYDTGSLIFNPAREYQPGQLAIYDNKLWKAKKYILPLETSTIDIDTQDWEYIDDVTSFSVNDYNSGITNNGVKTGTLTFAVPFDAPDILFYQGLISPDRVGQFIIADIESNTKINVDKDIIGKTTYTSSNGVEFTSGLVIEFRGNVTPSKYSEGSWLVEGVGKEISLTLTSDLIVPVLTADAPEVLFDNEGFDTQPFDDAAAFPGNKDYITISRNSTDSNPWSRYNRWFHRSVLEYSYAARGQDFPATESYRAKRPIIEFLPNLQLINHGSKAKQEVDYIDNYTADVFSNIEGSAGYNIDGEAIFEGARILVIADTDKLVNNKIYEVKFIVHNGRTQITLIKTDDTESIVGEGVLVRRGTQNSGLMYHYTGTNWIKSQRKLSVNQPPLFDVFDESGISFSDTSVYPVSTFSGNKLLSYKIGSSVIDSELGFSISYLNINNIGDIQFNWDWDIDSFNYSLNRITNTLKVATGFYKINPGIVPINQTGTVLYDNGWTQTNPTYIQPIVDSLTITVPTDTINLTTINWADLSANSTLYINFYVNGKKINDSYVRDLGTFTFTTRTFAVNDVIVVKIVCDLPPDTGYYEIPMGLEKNPLNDSLISFTLGQAIDHISTAVEFNAQFTGTLPGVSNLRDISDYQSFAKRFLKHAGIAPLAIGLLCDKTNNIIKAIQYNKKSYTEFKNNFLARAIEIAYNDNIADFVDDVIAELTKTKTSASPFSDSDMIGSGAFTTIKYTVEDTGIKTYSLSETFSLTELSRRAVYVYINEQQLLNTKEYTFNPTFGFVDLLVDLSEGDLVEIREYVSTAYNHIPPTPTSLGLYKKYTPMKFIDDTYVDPVEVIQGHDGSITIAYGDFRDDLLLELEYRIYNNIKQEYNEAVFNLDNIVGGYYGVGLYTKAQLDDIVQQEFLKWIQNTNINYTLNTYFDSEDSFTYTYSDMTDPTGTQNLPGYWRGVYQWFYDTDRPHRCPWEMLGFSEQPTWWISVYGPAPYTRNNLLLWEDLRDGIIRQGLRAGQYDRYKRSTLMNHIPVDGDGKLLSPLDSGLAGNFALINNQGPFILGDVSPVEYAWKASSEWPFAVTMAMCLMKPYEFINDSFDRSQTKINLVGQTVHNSTNLFTRLEDLTIPKVGTELTAGLVKYLTSYAKSKGSSLDIIESKIKNIDVGLSNRLSGFVDKGQQKYLLDSKNPSSSSSSIFIPPENYNIIFNVSAPIASVAYSGVILEKTAGGWIATGYDDIHPYFYYYEPKITQRDPLISVGGVSETFTDWQADKTYNNGVIVRYKNTFYRSLKTHISDPTFDETLWKKLPKLPSVGAVEALYRRTFNTLSIKKLSYGTLLTTIQEVVDLLLGYDAYLKSIGFTFNRYDTENQVAQDWLTSCKEFMFWTKHKWSNGSLITLSPGAEKLDITLPIGVADNILDGFYDYQILKGDGKPLLPRFINVNRSFQNITVETADTTDGIYYLKLFYVLKEHVTVFDDKTVFNDIIYDKTAGYRQERIKTRGFRTVEWDGDYTSPGFLFDNVDIKTWQPFVDYKLGDIVAYRSFNWTSLTNQLGTEEFNNSAWSKLDITPEQQLVSNFDYKINQFADYYEVAAEGIGQSQRDLARHAIGYQTREYLQNLSEDDVTQFRLYQGFIREKGTNNAITKIFNKLSRSGDAAITLNEEWAFRTGRFGGTDQLTEIEFTLHKNNLKLNPQPILLTSSLPTVVTDQNYRVVKADFTVEPLPFTYDINPVSVDVNVVRTAGYVKSDHVDFVVASRDDLITADINQLSENDHVWITFDNHTWTVLRFNEASLLNITAVTKVSNVVTVTVGRAHNLNVGDIVGIKGITNFNGFFKVTTADIRTFTVTVDSTALDPEFDDSTTYNLHLLTESRFDNYRSADTWRPNKIYNAGDMTQYKDSYYVCNLTHRSADTFNTTLWRYTSSTPINPATAALLQTGSKLWIDNNETGAWEVIQKTQQYIDKKLLDYGTSAPLGAGTKVLYNSNTRHVISSIPNSGYVMTYVETVNGLELKQIVAPPPGFETNVIGSFGSAMALSPDNRFLIIGSPTASGIKSNYLGEFNPSAFYIQDDIVLYAGKLWKALTDINGDGSTISVTSQDWEPATIIPSTSTGRHPGYSAQGMISVYEWVNQQWEISESFVSPRAGNAENFGSNVTISISGNTYYMAVSAIGSLDRKGRVYLYTYNGTEWSHLENMNYSGIYDSSLSKLYPAGSIVWYNSALYQAQVDVYGDGSTASILSTDWLELDTVSTQSSLPQNIALNDDGSTLALGLIGPNQLAELVKEGDEFGTSLAMNRDGSILVVGAPNSDGQYFSNYRGIWHADVDYYEGDVVKYADSAYDLGSLESYIYYRLVDPASNDLSTTRSLGEYPDAGAPWQEVGDSTVDASGKVYVYQRNASGNYELKQTITSGSLSNINDLGSEVTINSGDQLGWSVDIDYSGTTLVITSPKADINFQNQGSAYVFRTDGHAAIEFRLKQKLESFEKYPNEYFGQSVCISPNTEKIIIGAKNSLFSIEARMDITLGTTFDQGKTRFVESKGYAGGVYVFEQKDNIFFLVEKLETDWSPFESFGYSVDCSDSVIVVGSPDYKQPTTTNGVTTYSDTKVGMTRLFKKDPAVNSWNTLATQDSLVDISKIKSIQLYDAERNVKIQDIDYVDHAKLKVLNSAEQELKFKTLYDPAIYSIGTDSQQVDTTQAWREKPVGQLWWDISTAKWNYYEQGDLAYRVGNWNILAEGASIDIYEWVESVLLPSEWSAIADTNDGIANGVSGQPLYPNDDVYSIKTLFSSTTGLETGTLYYYWVKNKTTVPSNLPERRIAASTVASYISNPGSTGITFIALVSASNFLAYNFKSVISTESALLNIEYYKNNNKLNPIHNEYQLLTEGVADSLPTPQLEAKWIDSLVGADAVGKRVPDPNLSPKQQTGISFRPRQSMFIDRLPALEIAITNINAILTKEPFADIINFDNLNLVDEIPSSILNLYDVTVDTYDDLVAVGTTRIKQARLQINIVDGKIDTIDIIEAGFGYKTTPPIIIDGDGTGAVATATIDRQGRLSSVTVDAKGKKYTTAIAKIRPFSVLVNSDSTADNFWSIYAWDDARKVFFRSRSQAYNTQAYWKLIDWWKSGYSITDRIVKEISDITVEPTISIEVGSLLRVKEYTNGGWAVFEKINIGLPRFSDNYVMIARERGTIEFSKDLYAINTSGLGYDNTPTFDEVFYDLENAYELRNIFRAVKEDIFNGDYAVEWNKLFFNSIRYAFAEQTYIDWAFKTSFLTAIHNVGSLEQKNNYKNDNLDSFQQYIEEVKPYRTTVREYVSRYNTTENTPTAVADFDLPAVYSTEEGKIVPVSLNNELIQTYPWKWWVDNNGYSVTAIEVYDSGEGYSTAPTVLISGTGTGATAQAYISNGVVSGIEMLSAGTGYVSAPTITLVGGNSSSARQAKAVAIIGDTKIRTFNLTMKFDRISKEGTYQEFVQSQTFRATGTSAVFELNYAPTRDKSKITVLKNNQLVLNDEYSISLYTSSVDTYSLLKGKIIFNTVPAGPDTASGYLGDLISVEYEKSDELLDSVNRIQKYYEPSAGMKGDDLSQLMTGIDFGGVQIQGTTFDVTGGWDALPWFTDNWDSVESSADYYVVCDGSTNTITLPFIPDNGQSITIYIKRSGQTTSQRIDDPNYTNSWDSSSPINPNAQMPTFVGDGLSSIIEIGDYIQTNAGDILIFRPIESDGSVTITDPTLLDTKISGGSLSAMSGAYATATGTSAEDITIDGDKFISPDQVPAPEENIPGQVLDSVSIRVYNNTPDGVASLHTRTLISDGVIKIYNIGQTVTEVSSVILYVNKVKQLFGIDYTVDFISNQIEFLTTPAINSIIELISIGIGGVAILDYQEFVADGETALFLTSANFEDTRSIYVTVNGEYTAVGYVNSTDIVDTPNKTLIQFGSKPSFRDIVKIVCLGAATDVDLTGLAIVRVNQQSLAFDGSTNSFVLDNFVALERSDAAADMIVELNGRILRGPDTIYKIYDGVTNQFVLGTDPLESSGAILTSNIRLYINNNLKIIIQDYVYDGTSKVLTINSNILSKGDEIKIENDLRSEFDIINNAIVLRPELDLVNNDDSTLKDILNVTWFSEYPSMKLLTDEYTGGKVNYLLSQRPLEISYVWVYKNGQRLAQDVDYYVSLPRGVVYLNEVSTADDLIKIITFGTSVYRLPSAFEIHKDMLNVYQFKRFAASDVILAEDLNYFDQTITISDASGLAEPIRTRNIPGIIYVNGERIEYMNKTGNVLSQLRRGSYGTAIKETHSAGSLVVDVSPTESLPYTETQDREDFVSDGSSLLIGPLSYIPIKGTRAAWTYKTIPTTNGPCDQVEIFAGGRRLRKDPISVYTEELGASSPAADTVLEAEFSVDGNTAYIRLTSAIPAGTRISIISRTGRIWYERGETTATSGKSLLENATPIAEFIAQRTTKLPE